MVLLRQRRRLTTAGRRLGITAPGGRVVISLEEQIIAAYAAVGWTVYGLFLAREADVTLVSGKGSVWANLGVGGEATQGTAAARPTWDPTGLGTGASFNFDGGDWLQTATIDSSSETAYALSVLFKDTISAIKYPASYGEFAAGEGLAVGVNLAANAVWIGARGSTPTRALSASTISMASAAVVTATWDSALATNEAEIRHAGANVTDSRPSNGNNAAPSINDVLALGGRQGGVDLIEADISAVVLAGGTTAIPLTELTAVEALLAAEWGV